MHQGQYKLFEEMAKVILAEDKKISIEEGIAFTLGDIINIGMSKILYSKSENVVDKDTTIH